MFNKVYRCIVAILILQTVHSQDKPKNHQIQISSYIDTYFASYNNDLTQEDLQEFITVGARNNTFGINVAQLGLSYMSKNLRSNIILHHGDIVKATWSDDFPNIQEANIGVLIAEDLWLDAGFFATHIGTESFLPKNNMLSSTAFKTFNEPFYQAGAKLSYSINKWDFQLWVINGYNSFVDNNEAKSLGILMTYEFSDRLSITYTNLYGKESTDESDLDQNRFYQNLYLNYNWKDKLLCTIGFDLGMQTNSDLDNDDDNAMMYAGLATVRYKFNPRWSITGRAEIFRDENGFISGTYINEDAQETGVDLTGFTFGTEYVPLEGAYLRGEVRNASTQDDLKIFNKGNEFSNQRFEVLFTLGLEIEKIFEF